MRHLNWPDGQPVPVLGLGTWQFGERSAERPRELAAVREAISLGYRLFDTAEMYAEGGAEAVLGQGLADALRAGDVARADVQVVSKVYPHNASRAGTVAACLRSLQRLQLDQLDLYLLHWRGEHPLAETVAAMQQLQAEGRIRRWGVSNFDVDDLQELAAVAPAPADGGCACNQVYYSLSERGPEWRLLPWQRAQRMPLMAYSPIDQGALAREPGLAALAAEAGCSAAQLALAWVCRQPGVTAIPKAGQTAHLRDNLAAARLTLDDALVARLERLFPPPKGKTPLAMR